MTVVYQMDGGCRWLLLMPATDLASYLAGSWLKMNGREINWNTTSDNLYSDRKFDFLNVRADCHIALIQRMHRPRNCSGSIRGRKTGMACC